MTIDCDGSLLRPSTEMLPMFSPVAEAAAVSGTHGGPPEAVVRKLVVFHTPPLAPPAYTVLPDGSDGSTAIVLTLPALLLLSDPVGAGPIGVHAVDDCGSVALIVK